MLALTLIAISLLIIDSLSDWLRPTHDWLNTIAQPFQWAATLPVRFSEWDNNVFADDDAIIANNHKLKTEILVYKGKLQGMAELAAENLQLKSLLHGAELIENSVLLAEVVGISPDPYDHRITINRGLADNITEGQAVIDGTGLAGQIITVFKHRSQVLLITDTRHALPVYISRNKLRGVVEGTGDFHHLRLRHVSPTQDVKVGDTLLSSGIGGRFPEGYPVGLITRIEKDPGQAFSDILVAPSAAINKSLQLLVVFSKTEVLSTPTPPMVESNSELTP